MHISQAPAECIHHILLYLDLPDQHSLLLTCHALFQTVAPALYRSPFRALLAHDYGQRRMTATAAAWSPQDDTPSISNASTSLNSSTPSAPSTTLSSARTISPAETATSSKPAPHSNRPNKPPRRTRFYSCRQDPSHDQPSFKAGVETSECREVFKLKKMARLLQLLIACTSVQVRLPALQYPGYGQQWVRPPCKIDYLQYYVDQQQGSEIMVQCFHLLFADLAQSASEQPKKITMDELTANGGVGGSSITSENKKTLDVLHRIQREFVSHNASRIRTLSLSLLDAPSLQDALSLVPQMSMLTRLELTDFENQNSLSAEIVVDIIISHRMLFGPVLRENILVARGSPALTASTPTSATTTTTTTPTTTTPTTTTTIITTIKADEQLLSSREFSEPLSPTSRMFTTSLTKRPTLNKSILTMVEAFKDIEEIDATQWTHGVLYLDRIAHPRLKKLWLSFIFPPSEPADSKAARLSEYLERCRALEQIHIPIRRADVFHWAALEKKSALICAPILASSKAKKLPRMKRIHLQGPTLELMHCVQEATFAFQDTLKDLAAYSRLPVWQPTTLELTADMPQLTRLKLEGEISLYFSLDSLARCPALEELSLTTSAGQEWASRQQQQHQHQHQQQQQQPPSPSHQQQQLPPPPLVAQKWVSPQDPGSNLLLYIRSKEMHMLSTLRRLQSLSLVGAWSLPDVALRRVADRCMRMRDLRLDQVIGTSTGGLLLAIENMKRLERLDLRMSVLDLHLVRVVAQDLPMLSCLQLTSLQKED